MFFVVAYDIADPKRLAKIAKTMENYGVRVQKSVFECILDEKQYLEMKQKVEKIMNFNLDAVRYYFICQRCRGRIELSGLGLIHEIDDLIII